MSTTLMPNYARLPVTFVKGEGAWLWDTQGKRYLDAVSGIAVCSLGHAHPAIAKAICEQAQTLLHTSNIYGIAHQQTLADTLIRLTGMETAFFCNSGAEANEAAIKISRLYGHQQGIDIPTVIVMENAFHGRTLAALTATGNLKAQAGFDPLVQGFVRVPYNNIDAIHQVAAQNPNIVAILAEPVQGEGGVYIPDVGYLQQLRTVCDQYNWLLMLDEIQTGIGRTGKWIACQHEQVLPDVITLAKALGNGMPIGACLARGKVAGIFTAGSHGTTFGGNPLACRTALAVLETIENNQLLNRVAELGQRIQQGLHNALQETEGVISVRHKGLMIGIELAQPCIPLVAKALEQGLLINVTANRVIRLLPPFILTNEQADEIINKVSQLVLDFLSVTTTT
ncbi:aspartate aminotransferase family protein [Beggiatoa leptomitoformis]|uniref:Acetylornithine aminotransferase n=1 Tax=Beggiatoa leptomitoformis TaxID=288004 RepID=A0A2N9YI94_9GAMM|nr:aspartate aminotransferase family protein [Beggiatoa leptomitoformis]ALG67637.1 acetylornithine/succinylornithine family transaminase [Beggiatoa leptomitoformis]AUI70129.1 acetylornithine/succinylornithine family transaminase [Beggiatoa leptomitoformis]